MADENEGFAQHETVGLEEHPMATNYKGYVSNVLRQYESDAPSIPHAFQKDAIQNCTGARERDQWDGWRCCIDTVVANGKKLILVSDYGTTGLTGHNYCNKDIVSLSNNGYLTEHYEEKLARISSANNSGGNLTGGGLFGIGKTLYSIASNVDTCTYYFESVSAKEGYRASRNRVGNLPDRALEGEEAKLWWKENLGLEPRTEIGTTFVIVDPKEEITSAIEDGELLGDIEETWWRIFPFLSEPNEGIFVNGTKAKIPEELRNDNPHLDRNSVDYEKPMAVDDTNLYRVTKWGFHLLDKDIPGNLSGFGYYRKGMKICTIEMPDIPEKLKNRFFGYVEVDGFWEDELKKIENDTHYGITKKTKKEYTTLRNFAQNVVTQWLSDNGYVKNKESEDRKLHRLLENATDILQEAYENLSYEPLGTGDTKKKITFTWEGVVYPNPEEERTVHTGDTFKYGFKIVNKYLNTKTCNISISVQSNTATSHELKTTSISLDPGQEYEDADKLKIDDSIFDRNVVNYFTVCLKVGSVTIVKKKLLYYDIETEKNSEEDFDLSVDRTFPLSGRRRVNPGQSITRVVQHVTNNTEKPVKLRLLVASFNPLSKEKIEDLYEANIEASPDLVLDVACPDIVFKKDVYDEAVGRGQVEIRSTLTVIEDCPPYQKGFKAQKYSFFAFYNCGEKKGMENSFKPKIVTSPERHLSSWIEGKSGSWEVAINAAHPEFRPIYDSGDDDKSTAYIVKEENRQLVYIYIKEANYSIIGKTEEEVSSDKYDAATLVRDVEYRIEENWWKICQK